MTSPEKNGSDAGAWARVIDACEPATFGEVSSAAEEFIDGVDDGPAALEAAIDAGDLVVEDGGMFGRVALANGETDDDTEADSSTEEDESTAEQDDESDDSGTDGEWDPEAFTDPDSGVWTPERLEREQWMGHQAKRPFAPWGDRNADLPCTKGVCLEHSATDTPEHVREECPDCRAHREGTTTAECDHDARYKWGHRGHYVDGETVAIAEDDPRLDGRVFLQREDDPYAFVDGDDVRCPETGEVHPAFVAILDRLGVTYGDISLSGAGVHANYCGTLPEGVKEATFAIDDEPWGANDDLPEVEIYDGKHVCAATGEHVLGTPLEIREWDDEALEAVLDEYDELPTHEPSEYEAFDAEEYEAGATNADETTDDIRDIYYALDRLDAQRVAERTIVREWIDPRGTDHRAFVPTWAPSEYEGTANFVNGEVWKDSGSRGGKGGPACMAAIDAGLVRDDECPRAVRGETWRKAVDHLRDLGYSIPELETSDDSQRRERATVETCAPPEVDLAAFDQEGRRAEMAGPRYDAFIGADGPTIWGDHAGAGKTTTAGIAAGDRDRAHAFLFENHRKAREYMTDAPTPDDYYHLKGAAQMRHDGCMDADHAGEECHAHVDDCPHMCPVYDLDKSDPVRERYEAVATEVGPQRAHMLLGDELPDHDENGECAWLNQFEEAADADRIVGVHEYQLLKTVRSERDVIVDETPSALRDERRVTVEGLCKTRTALEKVGGLPGAPQAMEEFARFAGELVGVLTDPDAPDTLADLTPPSVDAETIHREVDPDDLPDDIDPDEVETEYAYEDVGMPEEGHRKRLKHYVERPLLAEALAEAKYEYHETLLQRMRDDSWDGEPLVFDALLAAAMEAGLEAEACRQAVALPLTLDSCPWCGSDLTVRDGARMCTSDGCDWHEEQNHYTRRDGELARTEAWIDLEPDDSNDARGIVHESLPLLSDLPDDPLVLDATATPAKVAPLYGTERGDVDVRGDDPLAVPNLHTTQILDGQYHAGTLSDSADENGTAAQRVQRTIDLAGGIHDRPLYVVKKGLKRRFDFPENGEVEHYHALRGLNYNDCDAVVCIGAPHPAIGDLEREARLLAQGRDDIRVGGEEHSTRRDAPNPPVYRKLLYEDEDGEGRAVPTKHYTGLVGELFRETREKELVQAVHRARPLLADETKHTYLLTNVPTDIDIDEVTDFETLADPVEALLPVPDGALDLLEAVRDVGAGDGPDGFRAEALVEDDGETVRFDVGELHRLARFTSVTTARGEVPCEQTVRRWKSGLVDLGVLDAGTYEQRRGVVYSADAATLTSALSVVSYNDGVEVAVKRRFRQMTAKAEGSLRWLRWARDALGLSGDRCDTGPPGGIPS